MNATVTDKSGPIIEGTDSSLRTTRGWGKVIGLGVPNTPALVTNLSRQ
jgi:hypothetical protein